MPDDIILIGPPSVGKSTLGKLLSARLGLLQIALDEIRRKYYEEIGYDDALAKELKQKGGFIALAFYWKLFDTHSVERVLADHHNCVFDFGAGATVNENRQLFERVERALAPYPNVFLILPSPDLDLSIQILNERTIPRLPGTYGQGFNWNEYFVRHPANGRLAKHIVYTIGKTPEETCEEILELARKKTV